jgi:twitching motility protein PilT
VLKPLSRPVIDEEEMARLCMPMLTPRLAGLLEKTGGVDFAYMLPIEDTTWRFRVIVCRQMGRLGLVARRVNSWIPSFEALHLPPQLDKLCQHHQGMVLLAGVTGCGKSTTIAAMLDYINRHYRKHILTLEDPIEFVFTEDKSLITQREIGLDVADWETAMKQAVREDPDVMLIGEMRDRETFLTAIQAAETGHLVFATIHASTTVTTIGRILDLFPADMHAAIRGAIAANMKAIISQRLLPSIKEGVARVPIVELMMFTTMIQKLIVEAQDEKLGDALRIGAADGMQDYTASLKDRIEKRLVDRAVAFEYAPKPEALKMALKGIDLTERGIL